MAKPLNEPLEHSTDWDEDFEEPLYEVVVITAEDSAWLTKITQEPPF